MFSVLNIQSSHNAEFRKSPDRNGRGQVGVLLLSRLVEVLAHFQHVVTNNHCVRGDQEPCFSFGHAEAPSSSTVLQVVPKGVLPDPASRRHGTSIVYRLATDLSKKTKSNKTIRYLFLLCIDSCPDYRM